MSTFFAVINKTDLEYLKKHDYLPFNSVDETEEKMDVWMYSQMKKRLCCSLFENKPLKEKQNQLKAL